MQNDEAATGEKFEKLGTTSGESDEELNEAQQERFDKWSKVMSGSDVPTFDDSGVWLNDYLGGVKQDTGVKRNNENYAEHMRKVIDESWSTEPEPDRESIQNQKEIIDENWLELIPNNKDDKKHEANEAESSKNDLDDESSEEVKLEFLDRSREHTASHVEQDAGYAEDLGQASQMASYGIDTAARLYGIETVINEIQRTDETNRDSQNPIGAIYDRLAPNVEARRRLFIEIHNDSVRPSRYAAEIESDTPTKRVGLDVRNHFYEKIIDKNSDWQWRRPDANVTQSAVDAIGATKKMLKAIDEDESFAGLRKRASEQGKTPFEYLIQNDTNITFSKFVDRVGDNSEASADALIEELKDQEEGEDKKFLKMTKELIEKEEMSELLKYLQDYPSTISRETAEKTSAMLNLIDSRVTEKTRLELEKLAKMD